MVFVCAATVSSWLGENALLYPLGSWEGIDAIVNDLLYVQEALNPCAFNSIIGYGSDCGLNSAEDNVCWILSFQSRSSIDDNEDCTDFLTSQRSSGCASSSFKIVVFESQDVTEKASTSVSPPSSMLA